MRHLGQWVAVSVVVLSSAHLDVEADFALTLG
jgi:hypothetical protein